MSKLQCLIFKSICISGAALGLFVSSSCSDAQSQSYAAQADRKSHPRSYATGAKGYSGNSYAQTTHNQGKPPSYASSGVAGSNATSYANSGQRKSQITSYAGSSGAPSGIAATSSFNRGTSYANPQHVKLGTSANTSLLGIMHGAPAMQARSDKSQARMQSSSRRSKSQIMMKGSSRSQPSSASIAGKSTNSYSSGKGTQLSPASGRAEQSRSIFSKLRRNY